MTRSANEVMVLASKAARGAGAPPAQASEFGRATLCHLQAGRDTSLLSDALVAIPKGPVMDFPIAFMQIVERGDDAPHGHIDAGSWLPLAQSYAEALPYAADVKMVDQSIHLAAKLHQPAPRVAFGRITVPETLLDQMVTLAARLLVPESDASRLGGAGAGLTDND